MCLSLNAPPASLPCNTPVGLPAVISPIPVANDVVRNASIHVVLQLTQLVKALGVPLAQQ